MLVTSSMGKKPPNLDITCVHTYWTSAHGLNCLLCNQQLEFAFNDGGRMVETLKGKLWVVTNYYRCRNEKCDLHTAFPVVHTSVIKNKKFGKDIWERVIRYHFKYHLDFSQIQGLLWDDADVGISKTTIRNICAHFEDIGTAHLDELVLQEIKANGYMLISLDGAQPKKGEPALWIFTDRITKHTLYAVLLDIASAPILEQILKDLELKFGVPIKAVISDKQKNIVNAVKQFNAEIPHAFCQYHFLNHVMEPIQAKNSHLATQLKKRVRNFSIIVNRYKSQLDPKNSEYNSLYSIFSPLAEHASCPMG